MRPALLLIDVQNDFLRAPTLEPSSGELVSRCAAALDAARAAGVPVVHVRTTVDAAGTRAMPHWRLRGAAMCVVDTAGHAAPPALEPRSGELIVHKTHYTAFEDPALDAFLAERNVDTIALAGLHAHACVQSTALDGYRSGRDVVLLEDAVGSDDPLHDATTRRYLSDRFVHRATTDGFMAAVSEGRALGGGDAIEHDAPHDGRRLFAVPNASEDEVRTAVAAARAALGTWGDTDVAARIDALHALADRFESERDAFTRAIVGDVGKPVTEATGEVARSVALLRAVAGRLARPAAEAAGSRWRRRPLGVVAMITPWNNPLAIPVGKLAGALAYGNAVVWKPAVPGTRIAERALSAMASCLPEGVVTLVTGGDAASLSLMRTDGIDAVTLSGSGRAGYAAQDACATRRIPLQAELGGNNAAIVWRDADVDAACRAIVRGALGFAGQRCTANRRVVVDAAVADRVLERLASEADALPWGDPSDPDVVMGPVISRRKKAAVESLLARCEADGLHVERHGTCRVASAEQGAYVRPAIVVNPDLSHEAAQRETFGPVLVVHTASSWEDALSLVNGVPQGLVAALFSTSEERRRSFLARAEAGILKLNTATDGASVDLPFGGWKASGVGPPEHGPGNEAFYTRYQSVYEE